MNIFHESKKVLDKDGKVNPLGPYGKQKLTGQEISQYFKKHKLTGINNRLKKAIEVALDLGGAMSVASKEIGKFYGNTILKNREVQKALKFANEEKINESKDVRKRYRGKEQKSVDKMIMHSGVDKVQKLFNDEPKEFDALVKRLAKLEGVELTVEGYRDIIKMFPSDRDWKKIVMKHRKNLDDFHKGKKDLSTKAEDDLITWALDNDEIRYKDEVEDFIDQVLNAGDWKEGETLVEKNLIPDLQNIVQRKQHQKVGGITVDMFTASMITQIYDKVNDANKKKMEKSNISTLVDLAQRIMRKNEKDPVSKIRKNKKDLLKSNKHAMDREPLKGYPYNEVKEDWTTQLKEHLLTEGMSKEMPLDVYADKVGIDAKEKKWIMDNEKEVGGKYYNNSMFPSAYTVLSYPIYDKDYYFAFIGDKMRENAKANASMNRELRRLKGMTATPEQKSKGFNDVHALFAKMYERFGMLSNLGAHDTMTREELSYAVTHIKTGKATNELAYEYDLMKAVDGGTFFEQIMDREQKPMKPKSLETRLKEGKHGKMLRNLQMKALRRKTRIKGRAGAFEAVSPAQQAAIAISKKERGEKPKKENVMDSYRQMWEDGQKYAPELEEDTIVEKKEMNPKIIQKIAKLTDRNDHNESLLILAKELKDKQAVKLLGSIKDMHKVYGHMPQELIKIRNQIFDNLMRQSKNAHSNHDDVYGAL